MLTENLKFMIKKENYYVTGDCHGDFDKLTRFAKTHALTRNDVIILLGDVGLNLSSKERDEKKKRLLAGFPNMFLCIHGNHEERPFRIESYREKSWRGGTVYWEPEFPNLLFAKDGELYDFNGRKAIAIGGAYSVDKHFRLLAGMPWFPDEQPSKEIRDYVERQLEAADWRVDYVLSHTCPLHLMPADLFLDGIDQGTVDRSTEEWLEQLYGKLRYDKWYFGHFHGNRRFADAEMLYEEIKELGSESFEQRLGYPKYKNGELVMFYRMADGIRQECYGRISQVDAFGTLEQSREVSYDIWGPDYRNPEEKVLYKHVVESEVESLDVAT